MNTAAGFCGFDNSTATRKRTLSGRSLSGAGTSRASSAPHRRLHIFASPRNAPLPMQDNHAERDSEQESSDYDGGGTRPDGWFLVLWALASAVGGTLGGFGLILSFFGQLILFGMLVGVVQTLALLLHRVSGAWLWIPASFFGWVLGSSVGAFDYLFLPEGMTNTASFAFIAGWSGLAVAQGLVLVYMVLSRGSGSENSRRRVLPVLTWFPVSILGGVLAGISSGALAAWMVSKGGLFGESGRGLLYQMAPSIIAEAIAGLIYGLLTGAVLLWLLRSLTPLGGARSRTADRGPGAQTDTP